MTVFDSYCIHNTISFSKKLDSSTHDELSQRLKELTHSVSYMVCQLDVYDFLYILYYIVEKNTTNREDKFRVLNMVSYVPVFAKAYCDKISSLATAVMFKSFIQEIEKHESIIAEYLDYDLDKLYNILQNILKVYEGGYLCE